MQITDGKLGDVTKFENVPDDEDRLIKDMEAILQEKMSKDYPEGQTKRDAHPKSLACLQAEFIVEPDIPAELKVGIFEFPQTYPAWIRISSASGNRRATQGASKSNLSVGHPLLEYDAIYMRDRSRCKILPRSNFAHKKRLAVKTYR